MEIKVSVVVPVYNRASFIDKALESLCNQSFKDFEVVIVDDGSEDDLDMAISKYSKLLTINKVELLHCGNIAFLRNVGARAAKGDYIAILDSDDWCAKERLKKQIDYMEKNPNVDIVATWVDLVNECDTSDIQRLEKFYNVCRTESEMYDVFFNEGCCLCNSSVMIRKSKIEYLGGYDERMSICEDFNLWLRALNAGLRISVLDEKLTFRRIHEKSVTEGYSGNRYAVSMVIKNKLELLYKQGKLNHHVNIWGVNARNDILIPEMLSIDKNISFTIIDIHNGYPKNLEKDAFNLVTTFSKKDEVFNFLNGLGLLRTKDYIYA